MMPLKGGPQGPPYFFQQVSRLRPEQTANRQTLAEKTKKPAGIGQLRLDTWLKEAGTSIGPYRDIVKDLPAPGAYEG